MVQKEEQNVINVLSYQDVQLNELKGTLTGVQGGIEESINESEKVLNSLGYVESIKNAKDRSRESADEPILTGINATLPDWDSLCAEAEKHNKGEVAKIEDLFSKDELLDNKRYIETLNEQFNSVFKLDELDWTICAVSAIVSAAMDILLVGIPEKTKSGLKAGPLSNYIRDYFDKKYPEEDMKKLGEKARTKTPYDAQDNRNTKVYVEGLSPQYHRLLQLGHDPLLGFFVGVMDILSGTMTTIDKRGKIVIQVIDEYSGRKETSLFEALGKQFRHLKSDVTTSMGLPVPLMGLFNLFQFGSIGKEDQTIAEIVQGMYYEGYDFIHFCSMSIPVMVTEIIVRFSWAVKRLSQGYSIKDSIPVTIGSKSKIKKPKLETMLFVAHSGATAVNAGKIVFTQNPMAINYPQWIAWAKYAFRELKWELINKPELQNKYVMSFIENERVDILNRVNECYDDYFRLRH